MPIIPIVSMIIPFIVSKADKNSNLGHYIPFISKIEYLKMNKEDNFLFEKNTTLPVLIVKQQTNPVNGEILQKF